MLCAAGLREFLPAWIPTPLPPLLRTLRMLRCPKQIGRAHV